MITSKLEVSAGFFWKAAAHLRFLFFRHLWSKQSNFQRSRVHGTILHWPSKPPMGPIFYRSLNLQLSSCQHRRWTQTWHDFLVRARKNTRQGTKNMEDLSFWGMKVFRGKGQVSLYYNGTGEERESLLCVWGEEHKSNVKYHQHMWSHFCGIVVVFRSAQVCRQLHSSKAAAETESLHGACKDGAGNRLFTWDKMEKSGIGLHMNKR